MIAHTLDMVTRVLVVGALVYATAVAATAWAVRTKRLQPFGAWPRFMRRASDPILRPLEQRVVRLGGNPQDASLWLIGIVIAGGLILISIVHWLIGTAAALAAMGDAGPNAWARLAVGSVFSLLMLALFIRVIASWLGVSEYSQVMLVVTAMTDWLLKPIRRLFPPMGMIDFSPMVAWLALWLIRGIVLSFL
ncbi:MAG TPA: YggT family protein [Gemmatimonadales bacterium]|jgi:YggT family protein